MEIGQSNRDHINGTGVGRDGVARAAEVQVMNKNKVITLRHSIQYYILEADC